MDPLTLLHAGPAVAGPELAADDLQQQQELLQQQEDPLGLVGPGQAARQSGPKRTRTIAEEKRASATSSSIGQEKRKRSRVTADQLAHLERVFAVDRSPTAARRKEISEMLGMQERQTQIWFQNRRAKAKLHDTKGRLGGSTRNPSPTSMHDADSPPDTPPELGMGFEADLQSLTHESEPISIIPCTDLTIGEWRRISAAVAKYDLVAYSCPNKRCLAWFIHSEGAGFKMEIDWDAILETEFKQHSATRGLATIRLSRPPRFYMEAIPPTSHTKTWKVCTDWTAGQQASYHLIHELIGSATQLLHALRSLPVKPRVNLGMASTELMPVHQQSHSPAPVHLHQPPQHSPVPVHLHHPQHSPAPVHLHQPHQPNYTYDNTESTIQALRRRSSTNPPAPISHMPSPLVEQHAPSPASATFPSHFHRSFFAEPQFVTSPVAYPPHQVPSHHMQPPQLPRQAAAPQDFTLQLTRPYPEQALYTTPTYHEEVQHHRLSAATTPLIPSTSAMSPLLASGFDPGDRHSIPPNVMQGLVAPSQPSLLTMPFHPAPESVLLSPAPMASMSMVDSSSLHGALGLGDPTLDPSR